MLTLATLVDTLFHILWATLRVGGMVMVAPVFGAMFVPTRVRLLITLVLSFAMLPAVGPLPSYPPLSVAGLLAVAQELIIGVAIGFLLKIAIEAAVIGGQIVSSGTGLSFAMVVDPQAGGIPLLGRFYLIIATLLMLSVNAHLQLIQVLAASFALLPIGGGGIGPDAMRLVADFAGLMFLGAVKLALPSVVAMLMVNVAFGVISRAAPTLNLFAVGFPITLLMGFLVILMDIGSHGPIWQAQLTETFNAINRMLGGG
ncbi:Flagellar biosynthetic protein FliR [Gammaproteobacteria bacterium]|nr:flagellar biosynthetic protein FliR [Gammaproteobacteria bacterium]QOJ30981.1 MAG: flagellar biosynthetic protein FliR [Gammaproteobacteria bacterium]CAG0938382.1 Flagellar biosynthetic protein FliR [Gammaproteobacteria bacterium]